MRKDEKIVGELTHRLEIEEHRGLLPTSPPPPAPTQAAAQIQTPPNQ